MESNSTAIEDRASALCSLSSDPPACSGSSYIAAKRTHWTDREENQLVRLSKKKRAVEIAEIIGRPYHGIKSKAERLGISLLIDGENHHAAKYPDAIVEHARKLNEEGLGERRISKALGICSMTVRAWIKFKTRTGISIRS